MSITDELSEYANRFKNSHDAWSGIGDDLTAIADRIDAEHEAMLADVRKTVYQGLIELPKDADGEYIHIGDVMELTRLSNKPSFEVRAMRYDEGGWEVFDRLGDRYEPFALRHHHAPTVEDVLTEFGIDWEHESDCEDRAALLKEYASKLQLKEDE